MLFDVIKVVNVCGIELSTNKHTFWIMEIIKRTKYVLKLHIYLDIIYVIHMDLDIVSIVLETLMDIQSGFSKLG